MAKIVDDVLCPMMNKEIELGYCVELQWIADEIADGGVKPANDKSGLTEKDFAACLKCRKRIDPIVSSMYYAQAAEFERCRVDELADKTTDKFLDIVTDSEKLNDLCDKWNAICLDSNHGAWAIQNDGANMVLMRVSN